MASLTLVIDDDLLQRARQEALRSKTSVNPLVRDVLRQYVDARTRRLAALASGSESFSPEPWTRESLHERG